MHATSGAREAARDARREEVELEARRMEVRNILERAEWRVGASLVV